MRILIALLLLTSFAWAGQTIHTDLHVDNAIYATTFYGSGSGLTDLPTVGGIPYPGAGIPLSTGSSWGTSITNNSGNWNTAYGWGNHASAGYLTANQSITLGGVLSGSGTTSITASAGSGYYMPTTSDQTNWNAKLSSVDNNIYATKTFASATYQPIGSYLTAVDDTIYAKLASPVFTGNVGIGTTVPLSSIEIISDAGLEVMSSNRKSVLKATAVNVGIGSTTPVSKLDVVGLIRATNIPQVVSLSGDVSVTTTAPANVTGLSISVSANTNYIIECLIQFASGATATGSKWSATIPSSPTLFIQSADVTTGTATVGRTTTASSDGGTTTASSGYASAANMAIIKALLLNGANAGTWQLRFASELITSGGTTTITAKQGSACWYWSY